MSEGAPAGAGPLDLVLDIGKTRSKLLVLDREGQVVAGADRASQVIQDVSYAALDTGNLQAWLLDSLAALGPLRARLSHAVVSAHGAAFAAVDGDQLAWPVPDYEFQGFDRRSADWPDQIDDFSQTLSPDLPRGLNGATQLDWLERHCAADFARGQLLPYAQYWSWWLSGVASSEVSSLGCHTHLWNPLAGEFSALAQRRGWAARFAPLRRAWEVLGPVRPALATQLGLPAQLRVHVGVHDSNACLARHLRSQTRLTLVTTGTWVVVMAPGAPPRPLEARRDLLANVSVRQEPVATGRFMGGRELQWLCAGADPALANWPDLQALVARGLMALPGFEPQGGPFRTHAGGLVDTQGPVALASLSAPERATLAALYCAQVTAWLIARLGGVTPVVLEGPFAANTVYAGSLAALCSPARVQVSTDPLEGTARGAWMLAHWTEPDTAATATADVAAAPVQGLLALHAQWLARLR